MEAYFYDWDWEAECLDEPMISPHFIPPGYYQTWNREERRWVIRSNKHVEKPNKEDIYE